MPTIRGKVVEQWTGRQIQGVQVNVGGFTYYSDVGGNFTVNTPAQGDIVISASAPGYQPMSSTVSLYGEITLPVTIVLTPIAMAR